MSLKNSFHIISRFIGVATILWLFEQVLNHYNFAFLKGNFLAFISITINLWLIFEVINYLLSKKGENKNLSTSLMNELETLYRNGNYEAILRHRQNFSRILWIEGRPKDRIRLGEIADDSAVKLKDKLAQISILIDDLGWSLASMHEFESAISYLQHGLKIAEQEGEKYWIAKAHRHLAGINVEANNIDKSIDELKKAESAASEIEVKKLKDEMLAGIYYGFAIAYLKKDLPEDALVYAELSENLRLEGGDRSRIVKILSLKGKIYEQLNDQNSAKDFYRQGLSEAKKIGRIDEVIRNHMGLSRVFELLGDKQESHNHLDEAKELSKNTPVPFEIDEKEFKSKLIKK